MKPSKDLLERVTAHVLEDAAFVFAMPREEEPPAFAEWHATGVRLTFTGPLDGYCELSAPAAMIESLAANNRVEDAEGTTDIGLDALKETLNILCGNLLTELAGEDPVFDLGTPTPLANLEPFPENAAGAEVWIDADEQPVLMRMCIRNDSSQAA
jgi:hypothetical protein